MPNKALLALAARPQMQRFISSRSFTSKVAKRFVAGDSLTEAVDVAKTLNSRSIGAILDYLGENVASEAQADDAAAAYIASLGSIAGESLDAHISVKPTQLGMDLSEEGPLERMQKICAKAAEVGTVVAIDMESHEYTDRTIRLYRQLRSTHSNVTLCLQSYLKRTDADVVSLLDLTPSIRLCKGAYNEPDEITNDKPATNASYLRNVMLLLQRGEATAIATHDDSLIKESIKAASMLGVGKRDFEFQMLYGVRRDLQQKLADAGFKVRVYVPFGNEWYPYLMRRLAERPANLRFFLEALIRG